MTHKLTRLLALMLAVVMTVSMLLVPVEAASFTDVKDGAWYASAVEYVNERGWMAGVSETSFAPNAEVTRGMMVTVLARLADAQTDNDTAAFADTAAGRWYTGAAAWAAEQGIVAGIGGGRFAPNRAITRQDLCVMLYAYVEAMGIELENTIDRTFSDMESVADYAREAVIYCAGTGLIAGYTDSSFGPKQTATRAQLAQILMRLDLLIKGEDAPTDPMPAQSFDSEAGEDMNISVEAPKGALPRDTEMEVTRVTNEALLASIQEKADGELLAAANITFYKDGDEVEPASGVTVQIALDGLDEVEHPAIVHVRDDGTMEYIRNYNLVSVNRSPKAKAIRFKATDFSVYAIIAGNGNNARLKIQFHMPVYDEEGNFTLTEREEDAVYVTRRDVVNLDDRDENNQSIAHNYLPTIIPDMSVELVDNGPHFFGWTNSEDYTSAMADGTHTIDLIRDDVKTKLEDTAFAASIVDGVTTYHVYPILFYFYTVSYLDEDFGATLYNATIFSKTKNVTYHVYNQYEPYTAGLTADGWFWTHDGTVQHLNNGDDITIHDSIMLQAKVLEGYYISFNEKPGDNDHYKGATYRAPVFCLDGKIPANAKPTTPTLAGYEFADWYYESDFVEGSYAGADTWNGTPFDFTAGRELNVDPDDPNCELTDGVVRLCAKWTPLQSSYKVIIWVQSNKDAYNAATKSYDYYNTISVDKVTVNNVQQNVMSGTKVKLPATYLSAENVLTDQNAFYFTLNTAKSDSASTEKVVAGDGSTYFQVYFDRKIITFDVYSTVTSLSSSVLASGTTNTSGSSGYNVNVQHFCYSNYYGYLVLHLTSINENYPDENGNIPSNYARFQYDGSTSIYTASQIGTIYHFKVTSTPYYGLYGSLCENFPDHGSGYKWHFMMYDSEDGYPGNYYDDSVSIYRIEGSNGSDRRTHMVFWKESYNPSGTERFLYTFKQDEEGNYPSTANETGSVIGRTSQYFDGTEYYGFKLEKYSINGDGNYTEYETGVDAPFHVTTSDNSSSGYKVITANGGYFYYARNQHAFDYIVNGTRDANSKNVYYDADISGFGAYEPAYNHETEWFDGWYKDPECTQKYDFTNAVFQKMPDNPVAVYGKVYTKQFRVFLYANFNGVKEDNNISWPVLQSGEHAGEEAVTWSSHNQTKNFLISYRGGISGGTPITGKRIDEQGNEYAIVGWYRDQACTVPFDFSTLLTDAIAETYYKTDDGVHPIDYTDYVNDDPAQGMYNKDAAKNRGWVQMKVCLYAKWRKILDGADGIQVRYESIQEPGTTDEAKLGYFENGEERKVVYLDPHAYADGSKAIATAGSIPVNTDDYRFVYWQMFDKDGNAVGDPIYPGQPFEVNSAYAAVYAAGSEPSTEHTHYVVHVEAKAPNCGYDGNSEYWYCPLCGKYFSDSGCTTETTLAAVTLAANGQHSDPLLFVKAVEPTCGQEGHAAYYRCETCGKYFTDENAENETTLSELRIAPTGEHRWSDWTADGENGHKRTCYVCNLTDTQAHAYGAGQWISEPTATEDGSMKYVCAVCSYEHVEVVPATGTQYTLSFSVPNGVEDVASITAAEGSEIRLPSAGVPGEGYTFLGWVTQNYEFVSGAPSYQGPGSAYELNGNATLTALYRYTTTVTETVFKRLTETPTDWAGNYVITDAYSESLYVLKGLSGDNWYQSTSNGACVAYSNSGMTLSDDTTLRDVGNDYVFTVTANGSYYTILSASQSTYVATYYSSSNSVYGLYHQETYASNSCDWTLTQNGSGYAQILNVQSGTSMRRGSSNSTPLFAVGSSSTSSYNTYLWKETTVSSEQTSYTTVLAAPPAGQEYEVSFSVPSGVTQPAAMTWTTGDAGLNLPTAGAPQSCTFVGWVAAPVTSGVTDQPALVESPYTPTKSCTLYALYSYTATSPSTLVYELVESTPSGWAGNYVISNGTTESMYVLKGVTGSASGTDAESGSNCTIFTSTGITLDGTTMSNVPNDYVVALAASGSYYTVQSAGTGCYYGMNSSSYLYAYSSVNTTYCRWTPAINSSGMVQLKNSANGSYPYFGWSTSNSYFWSASESNANVLRLWAETTVPGVSTLYYSTQPGGAKGVNEAAEPVELEEEEDLAEVTAEVLASEPAPAEDNSKPAHLSAATVQPAAQDPDGAKDEYGEPVRGVKPAQPIFAAGDEWEPYTATTIDTNREYLITIEYNGVEYVVMEYNPVEGYNGITVTYSSGNKEYAAFLGAAVFDGAKITGMTYTDADGATTNVDLQYATWTFSASSGGYLKGSYGSSYFQLDSSTSNGVTTYNIWPSSTGTNLRTELTYDATTHRLYSSASRYFGAMALTDGRIVASNVNSSGASNVYLYTKKAANATRYVRVDDPVDGQQYLIGYELSGTYYLISTGVDSSYSRPKVDTVTISQLTNNVYEIADTTGSSNTTSNLFFTATASGNYWRFHRNSTYLGISGSYSAYLSSAGANANWTWNAGILGTPNSTSYPNLRGYSGYVDISSSSTTFHLYQPAVYTVTFVNAEIDGGNTLSTQTGIAYGAAASAPANPTSSRTGYTFVGWDTEFDYVTENLTITAIYERAGYHEVTFVGRNNTVIQVNGSDTQSVADGGYATLPDNEDIAVEGYTFKEWRVNGVAVDPATYPITEDTVFTAIYEKNQAAAVAKTYVLTLRAVYGPAQKLEKTHVTWYVNNETKVNKDSDDVVINSGIKIENFDTFPALAADGRIFLGWARMPEMASDVPSGRTVETYTDEEGKLKVAEYTDLTENDLWLVYHEEDGTFTVNPDSYNAAYDPDPSVNPNYKYRQIAANERAPYHGLYAVWVDGYYIYHSSDGTLEAVQLNRGQTANAIDLVSMVKPGYLYGGYYMTDTDEPAFGGVTMKNVTSAKYAAFSKNVGERVATVTDYVEYTGASLYNDGSNTAQFLRDEKTGKFVWINGERVQTNHVFWDVADAKTASGRNYVPKTGDVIYLKEVPVDYLPNRMVKTYHANHGDQITDLYMLSAIDDACYGNMGFIVKEDGAENAVMRFGTLTETFTVDVLDWGTQTYTASNLNSNLTHGYVAVRELGQEFVTNNAGKSFTVQPIWTTKDGVTIPGSVVMYTISQDMKTITAETVNGPDYCYIDFAGGRSDGTNSYAWEQNADVYIVFANNNANEWKQAVPTGNGRVYQIEMPTTSYDRVIILRCNPNYTGSEKWSQGDDYDSNVNVWARTQDMYLTDFLNGNKNMITQFWKNGTVADLGNYTPSLNIGVGDYDTITQN